VPPRVITFLLTLGLALGARPDSAPAQQSTQTMIRVGSKCLVSDADRAGAGVRLGPCAGERARYRLVEGTIRTVGGECLDWINEGGPVHMAECRPGRRSQLWSFHENGQIRSTHREEICMDVEGGGTRDGTRVLAWRCQGDPAPAENQRFRAVSGDL
jgi:hypothetical protein